MKGSNFLKVSIGGAEDSTAKNKRAFFSIKHIYYIQYIFFNNINFLEHLYPYCLLVLSTLYNFVIKQSENDLDR